MQLDSAILSEWGNSFQDISRIKVPAGTTIYEGISASQIGQIKTFEDILGGGNQVVIPKVNPQWLIND